jgi:hypothetical protein
MGKNLDPGRGSRKNIPVHISKSIPYVVKNIGLKILKIFVADLCLLGLNRASRMKKFEHGIQDKHPRSATLQDQI